MHTFSIRSAQSIEFIEARNGRVLATTGTHAYVFHSASIIGKDTKHMCIQIDTGDNEKALIRNATFAGSLLFLETASRHFFIIDFVKKKQRIIPSELGSIKTEDTEDKHKYEFFF